MTALSELNLSGPQLDILEKVGITEIEDISEEFLEVSDQRMSKGIRRERDAFNMRGGFDVVDPEDNGDAPPEQENFRNMTIGERLDQISRENKYIRKLSQLGMDFSAVEFDTLILKIRDSFLRWGVWWYTADTRVDNSQQIPMLNGSILIMADLLIYTFRFQCIESGEGRDSSRDVTVSARSFDCFDPQGTSGRPRGDKGPQTSHTMAQKMVLLEILKIPAGDDPDFTNKGSQLSPGSQEAGLREALCYRLQAVRTEEQIKGLMEALTENFHRDPVDKLMDVDSTTLARWVDKYEGEVKS